MTGASAVTLTDPAATADAIARAATNPRTARAPPLAARDRRRMTPAKEIQP